MKHISYVPFAAILGCLLLQNVASVEICKPKEFVKDRRVPENPSVYKHLPTGRSLFKKEMTLPEGEEVEMDDGEVEMAYDFEPHWRSFRSEVSILSALSGHASFPQIFCASAQPDISLDDYTENADYMYVMMEYVPWPHLEEFFVENRDPEVLRTVIKKIAEAIQELHDVGVIHLDIKPENILTNGENVKIIDFGGSVASVLGIPEDDYCHFTQLFSAPENDHYTVAFDWYGLGATAHFCRALQLLGVDDGSSKPRNYPLPEEEADLIHFIKACTASNPKDRVSSLQELLNEEYLKK